MSKSGGASRSSSGAAARRTPTQRADSLSREGRPFTNAQFESAMQSAARASTRGHQQNYALTIGGDRYFAKRLSDVKDARHEMAAAAIARLTGLGEYTLPVYPARSGGRLYLVTPHLEGRPLGDPPVAARARLKGMPDAIKARLTLFSFVINDIDRQTNNYWYEPHTGRVISLDHGMAFNDSTGRLFSSVAESQFGRAALGNGKLDSWRDFQIPRAEIQRFVDHSMAIGHIMERYGMPYMLSPEQRNLQVLRGVLRQRDASGAYPQMISAGDVDMYPRDFH